MDPFFQRLLQERLLEMQAVEEKRVVSHHISEKLEHLLHLVTLEVLFDIKREKSSVEFVNSSFRERSTR